MSKLSLQLCFLLLLKYHNAATTESSEEDPKIHFPGGSNNNVDLNTVNNCVAGFCIDVPNYPKEQVDKMLEKHPEYHNYLEALDIGTRSQFDNAPSGNQETICDSTTNFQAYKGAKNQDEVMRILVQSDARKQYVYTESCTSAGSECKYKSSFPLNVEVKCQQKFMKQRLLVADTNGTLFLDVFTVPCCCVCTIYPKTKT